MLCVLRSCDAGRMHFGHHRPGPEGWMCFGCLSLERVFLGAGRLWSGSGSAGAHIDVHRVVCIRDLHAMRCTSGPSCWSTLVREMVMERA